MAPDQVPFGLATIFNENGNLETALVLKQWVYPLSKLDQSFHARSMMDLLQDWPSSWKSLQRLASDISDGNASETENTRIQLQNVNFDTPIRYPNKLLAVGANYSSHLEEMGLPAEKWDPMPFFSCPPTSSIVG